MVTVAQAASARPFYEALQSVNAALAELSAANGTDSIIGFTVQVGDPNGNPQGVVSVQVPLTPAQAAPFFTAMITQLTTLQQELTTSLTAI